MLSLLFVFLFGITQSKHCFDVHQDENGKPSRVEGDYSMTSENGYLNVNGKRFNLKGTSWFGFETSTYVVHGLWVHDYHWYLSFLANYTFNAMRIPFSVQGVETNPIPNSITTYQMNQDLANLTSLQVLDKIIEAAGDYGILVMLDMHSLEHDGYMEDGLWYDSKYSATDSLNAWKTMINRYKGYWNVIAMDVFNEPFDATWGTGNSNTDFNTWCETVGNTANTEGADWLVFCEGVADSPPCSDACFWGEDLQGESSHPVTLTVPNKLVYSPHCYGPSVATQKYFSDPNFPNNMPAIWDTHYGFIRKQNQRATVVGEWGGQMSGNDETWMNAYGKYLVSNDIPDTFFWCLNSDSGDTGGLLDGWNTPDMPRLNLLENVQPNPTKVTKTGNKVCFHTD